MSHESLWNDDWNFIVETLGEPAELDRLARKTGAFTRARRIKTAADLLRLCFAYGPGQMCLRTASAWAQATGLAQLSDVALMERLQKSGDWLAALISRTLSHALPRSATGRPVRLVDGSVVRKTGAKKSGGNGLWRLHAVFQLGSERFDYLELTDQHGGECLDRAPVVRGEIRIGDRACLQPGRIAHIMESGGDVIVRAPWKAARWRDQDMKALDIIEVLALARQKARLDMPVCIARKGGDALRGLRLVALRKPKKARQASPKKRGRRRAGEDTK